MQQLRHNYGLHPRRGALSGGCDVQNRTNNSTKQQDELRCLNSDPLQTDSATHGHRPHLRKNCSANHYFRMLTDAIHSFPVHRIRLKATHLPGPATVWQDGPTDDTTQNHATQLLPAQRH